MFYAEGKLSYFPNNLFEAEGAISGWECWGSQIAKPLENFGTSKSGFLKLRAKTIGTTSKG